MSLDTFFAKDNRSLRWIAKGILLFWMLWSLLVALSDTVNLLQRLHLLPAHWVYTSGNYDLVVQTFSLYKLNNEPLFLLSYFVIVVFAWVITFFFARAVWASEKNGHYLQRAYTAFLVILAIDAGFILADELFIQYAMEHGHMNRLGFKLLTFIVFLMLEKPFALSRE
ncbi:hypothetical protein DIZ81_13240 [Legionella taurinensis]|uniref:DUF2569 family protein n=1 Tax=Legionella taurinensis TaxID=70611 RepID=A0A3A5LAN1_9GAMM|nr:hypothetical protein [Legionella taurinensis]MDX1836030.1 hypothetical protein [Legionella taurinensis]PUT38736.1 hypothetical protein DB744_13250 [Legionella taurinensis]PUT40115.1 hypothetical protein DB746_12650 [Legionella taurinensis]PUT42267.1 hypothetical protein DB743_13135 [Legionella taurinensis]PUT46039.1 hypothetical protein DB745_12105 [Legionella taurinensis]